MKCRTEAQVKKIIQRGLCESLKLKETADGRFAVILVLNRGDEVLVRTTNERKVKKWKRVDYLWGYIKKAYGDVPKICIEKHYAGEADPVCTCAPDDY
jgi:hypothetical protein